MRLSALFLYVSQHLEASLGAQHLELALAQSARFMMMACRASVRARDKMIYFAPRAITEELRIILFMKSRELWTAV